MLTQFVDTIGQLSIKLLCIRTCCVGNKAQGWNDQQLKTRKTLHSSGFEVYSKTSCIDSLNMCHYFKILLYVYLLR